VREIGDGHWIELLRPEGKITAAYWERGAARFHLPHVVVALLTGQFTVPRAGSVLVKVEGQRSIRLGDTF
jgi:hypothetical protein